MQERSTKYSRHAVREERQRTGGSKIGNFNIFTNEPITECPITGNICWLKIKLYNFLETR